MYGRKFNDAWSWTTKKSNVDCYLFKKKYRNYLRVLKNTRHTAYTCFHSLLHPYTMTTGAHTHAHNLAYYFPKHINTHFLIIGCFWPMFFILIIVLFTLKWRMKTNSLIWIEECFSLVEELRNQDAYICVFPHREDMCICALCALVSAQNAAA